MRRYVGSILIGVCMLTACQIPVTTDSTGKKVNKPDPKASAKPSESPAGDAATDTPSTAPSTGASTSPSTQPQPSASVSVAPSTAPSPTGPVTSLLGQVRMDANYVIQTGGGNFVATNGGTFVATNGGTVISVGGGNVIATGGGNVISTGGGNFVATNGGTVISVGGGNVISTGGGNVISTGGGNYRLPIFGLLADAGGPAPGEMLPIKGMVVVPVSLSTGKPIGPAVLTNEKGEYDVKVPEATQENVLIFAGIPGKGIEDLAVINNPQLRLGAIVNPQKSAQTVIDEDSGQVTRYMLLCLINRLRRVFESEGTEVPDGVMTSMADLPDVARAALAIGLKELKAEAETTPFKRMSERDKQLFMHHLNDVVIAKSTSPGLDEITIKEHHLHYFRDNTVPLKDRSAMGVFKELNTYMRPKSQAKLSADPDAFDTMLATINTYRVKNYGEAAALKVERASDVMDMVVKAFMAENPENDAYSGVPSESSDDAAGLVFTMIGAAKMPVSNDPTNRTYASQTVLRAATMATLEGVITAIFNPEIKASMKAAMKDYKPMDPLKP